MHALQSGRMICDYLKGFAEAFTGDLDFGERKLLIESLVNKAEIGTNKKVTVTLQPPLHSLGFLSPSLALRGIEPRFEE